MVDKQIAVPECFIKVAELAIKLGAAPLNKNAGCWEHRVDEDWSITLNPHDYDVDDIPPFCMAITYNGWPAGLVSPANGGVIAAGASANEDAFIEALEQAIAEAPATGKPEAG